MKKEIPIVFTPDENYMVPTCVAILSILRTKNESTNYMFYLVISDKFNTKLFRYLEEIKKIKNDFEYKIKYIKTEIFEKQKIYTKHLSTSAYYRLILADILTDYDKCIYHDGDILVQSDLSEMYNVNLDDYYVAGVKAAKRYSTIKHNLELINKWGFPSVEDYILSGDLVFNLNKIRKDHLTDKMIAEMDRGFPSEDQDIINLCCYGKIYFLPLKFCMMNRWIYNNALEDFVKQSYSKTEIIEAKKEPVIVHFAGANTKPWNNLRTAFGQEWWKYVKEILSEKEYLEWYQRAERNTNERDWHYLSKQLQSIDSVMIFGFSEVGRELFYILRQWGYKIKCFIDNDNKKQGSIFEECEVLDVQDALKRYNGTTIINTSQRFPKQVRQQLITERVPEDKIIDYNLKNETYYLALAPEWYTYEFSDICLKKFGWSCSDFYSKIL